MASGAGMMGRRGLLQGAAAGSAMMALGGAAWAKGPDLKPFKAEIEKRHDEAVARLQNWIRQPSIAAENRGMEEGCKLTMEMLKDAGFQTATRMPTDGQPGIFATLDAGAPRTVGMYFMYDVKQVNPAEWISPPFDANLVDKPGFGKVIIGRGAVNQKGPEATFLAALHAIRGAGKKLPVNLVLVAEGEEEIASPHFPQVVRQPQVLQALSKCGQVWMPMAGQDPDGSVSINLGAKGVVELELVSSGAKWGRGPSNDLHSSYKAALDSPAWRLVQALTTLVSADGNDPVIDGWFEHVKPLTPRQKELIAQAVAAQDEKEVMKQMGVQHWVRDLPYLDAMERLASQPTVNIEGLVAGYTGVGGKTILPGRAVAKLDLRIVPDQTAADCIAKLKAHLAKRGFGDIEVNVSGGYDPTQTEESSSLIQSELAVYRRRGLKPLMNPRLAGSWPGYIFTGAPVSKPAGHFGLGHGSGAHAPNEYYVIESSNPKVEGIDGATLSYIEFLYALASAS
ncbi:M20/M25/M40 family metallo-hydrolase [Phenylobacterium aquaticum]|uniref:M20/M25/M40 family metallo-hydrolase n=1 Tax=Phenylobacterium aquaticum TaxID=1763816 RepID=UPI001F5D0787|nr:M20/M25/M40 family metallo-hydrolase [Phenylobacterium aquaticum]MCI3131036.1 M20/M25/M40 family metallo-hydrolase [Phenylobacterium aquaticum]